jgi:transcriptional regulator with XRE-family HTH domain
VKQERPLTNVREHLQQLMDADPELAAEYERLGPRFEAVSAMLRARKREKLSQVELARRMGVSQAVISRLESAEHSPRLETLAEAARAMGYRMNVRFVRERSAPYDATASGAKPGKSTRPKASGSSRIAPKPRAPR